jgi:hypothetical protein
MLTRLFPSGCVWLGGAVRVRRGGCCCCGSFDGCQGRCCGRRRRAQLAVRPAVCQRSRRVRGRKDAPSAGHGHRSRAEEGGDEEGGDAAAQHPGRREAEEAAAGDSGGALRCTCDWCAWEYDYGQNSNVPWRMRMQHTARAHSLSVPVCHLHTNLPHNLAAPSFTHCRSLLRCSACMPRRHIQ